MGPTASQIGAWLEEQRDRVDLPRDVAAQRVGTKERTLFRWEKGKNSPPVDKFLALVVLYRAFDQLDDLLAKWERLPKSDGGAARAAGGRHR